MRRLILMVMLCITGAVQANATFTAQYEGLTNECYAGWDPRCRIDPFYATLHVQTTSAADGNYWGVFGRDNDSQYNTLISFDLLDAFGNAAPETGYTASVNVTILGWEVTFFGGSYQNFYYWNLGTIIGPNTVTKFFYDILDDRVSIGRLVVPVPEPETYVLMIVGVLCLSVVRRRQGAVGRSS